MQLADDSMDKGCLRKFWYAYVKGIKEPPSRQMAAGTADHAIVEKYLETGKRVFSPRVAKGIHMLPPPGPHLQIEHDMVPVIWEGQDTCVGCAAYRAGYTNTPEHHTCKKKSGLHLSKLRAAGIPIAGRIDLMHDLGINYGADSPEHMQDPPNTVEVFDHKFTRDLRYAVKGPDLAKTIQMVAYGEYVFRAIEGVERVRLSHGTYPTEGNARKSTILVTREPLDRYWTEHVEPLARSIADAAKETNPDLVKANTKACKAFGRTCIHAEYCSAGMDQGLSSHVGGTAAKALLDSLKKPKDPNMALIPGKGLLAHIQKAPAAADTSAREAELAKLKLEEVEAKKKAFVPDGFGEMLATIEAYGKGMPQINGDAAKAYAAFKGYAEAAHGYAGSGELAVVAITMIDDYATLLKDLAEMFGEAPAAAPSAPPVGNATSGGLLPDDLPVSGPTIAQAPVTPTPNPMEQIQASADKPKATRKPRTLKTQEVTAPSTPETPTAPDAPPAEPDAPSTGECTDPRVNLVVDVSVEGPTAFHDFSVMIDSLTSEMAHRFNLDDCRTAPAKDLSGKDHPLSFGKWKGVLAAAINDVGIPGGTYVIDARGNEIYEEAVQALRKVVKRTGGFYLRGTR